MKIKIVCLGNIKETYFKEAINEYSKRLSRFVNLEIIEIKEEKLIVNYSQKDIENALEKEAEKIEKLIEGFTFVCDVNSTNKYNSLTFAEEINKIQNNFNTITFVIGSSYGLSNTIKTKANAMIKFSDFTFPHQLFRVILLEQIYRAFTINNNITYHK